MNVNLLVSALQIALFCCGIFLFAGLGAVGFQYLKLQLGDQRYGMVEKAVTDVVRYLEQVGAIRGFSNEEMKAQAVEVAMQTAYKFGVPMDYEKADVLVESIVQLVKSETPKKIAEAIYQLQREG